MNRLIILTAIVAIWLLDLLVAMPFVLGMIERCWPDVSHEKSKVINFRINL